MSQKLSHFLQVVCLLTLSNTFMSIAWYGHLKHKEKALLVVILLSWGIALLEYVFQVPANRIGSASFSVTQLKIIQEGISLTVFVGYAWIVFQEKLRWNTALALVFVFFAVYLSTLSPD
jgi:uncharacterized protein